MAVKPKRQPIHGWIVIDKPHGLGSTQALAKVRWALNAEKAGHGGTLDPLATGLLPIALGEATKTVSFAMDGRKTYQFTVAWGAETATDDLEGEQTAKSAALQYDFDQWKRDQIDLHVAMQQKLATTIPQFLGAVQQRPPAYSAIKVEGERSYDLARDGKIVELAPREVEIRALSILETTTTETTFEVDCGKGTYVRSLARDLGRATGWLGHVTMLRRTRVGPFSLADAISLEKLEEMRHSPHSENSLAGFLRPIETVLDGIPALAVMEPEAKRLKQGQRVPLDQLDQKGSLLPDEVEAVLVTLDGQPVGLFKIENRVLKAIRLFNL